VGLGLAGAGVAPKKTSSQRSDNPKIITFKQEAFRAKIPQKK